MSGVPRQRARLVLGPNIACGIFPIAVGTLVLKQFLCQKLLKNNAHFDFASLQITHNGRPLNDNKPALEGLPDDVLLEVIFVNGSAVASDAVRIREQELQQQFFYKIEAAGQESDMLLDQWKAKKLTGKQVAAELTRILTSIDGIKGTSEVGLTPKLLAARKAVTRRVNVMLSEVDEGASVLR